LCELVFLSLLYTSFGTCDYVSCPAPPPTYSSCLCVLAPHAHFIILALLRVSAVAFLFFIRLFHPMCFSHPSCAPCSLPPFSRGHWPFPPLLLQDLVILLNFLCHCLTLCVPSRFGVPVPCLHPPLPPPPSFDLPCALRPFHLFPSPRWRGTGYYYDCKV